MYIINKTVTLKLIIDELTLLDCISFLWEWLLCIASTLYRTFLKLYINIIILTDFGISY